MTSSSNSSQDTARRFAELKPRLPELWQKIQSEDNFAHTSVIVPSQTVNQEELAKIEGAPFYEERLLFALIRLRNPNARLIYVTGQPIHQDVIDYYLQYLVGIPARHAHERLRTLSVFDSSPISLTQKLLSRPRVIRRLKKWIVDPRCAYLTCYNVTPLERQLAVELDIPLNGVDPELLSLGTKSGSREAFAEAGVDYPLGFENLHTENDILDALIALQRERKGLKHAVVKINEGFSGAGNAVFSYPEGSKSDDPDAVRESLHELAWSGPGEDYDHFMSSFREMGGVVEELIEADEVHSPSVQMRVTPDGVCSLISTHEQVLGGETGQTYLGCRFPADERYRGPIQDAAIRIGDVLAGKGVLGRFGIDFLIAQDQSGDPRCYALEINLRMGGTTPPFHALQFLTGGDIDQKSGMFVSPDGRKKFYYASDNLKSKSYVGLLPEDLMEIIAEYGIHYRHSTGSGVLFYMFGALSQFGKLGMTCIGNSPEEANELFDKTVAVLDAETHSDPSMTAHMTPLFDRPVHLE